MSARIGGSLISVAVMAATVASASGAMAEQPDQPQHVEVAGRVVGEAGVGVEAAGAVLGQRRAPTQ